MQCHSKNYTTLFGISTKCSQIWTLPLLSDPSTLARSLLSPLPQLHQSPTSAFGTASVPSAKQHPRHRPQATTVPHFITSTNYIPHTTHPLIPSSHQLQTLTYFHLAFLPCKPSMPQRSSTVQQLTCHTQSSQHHTTSSFPSSQFSNTYAFVDATPVIEILPCAMLLTLFILLHALLTRLPTNRHQPSPNCSPSSHCPPFTSLFTPIPSMLTPLHTRFTRPTHFQLHQQLSPPSIKPTATLTRASPKPHHPPSLLVLYSTHCTSVLSRL